MNALDTVVEVNDFTKNIFTTSDKWTEGYVTTVPVVSEATTWTHSSTDITSYLSTTGSLGTLVFTLEDDVTDFDITVTGTVSGLASDQSTTVSETITSFVIDVV